MGTHRTRIGLTPGLTRLLRLFHVSQHPEIVGGSDIELLRVTGSIPQLISFASGLRREVRFSNFAIQVPQHLMCHRECGVDFNGALV